MGTVFKKQYTKPLPKGAEVLTQEGKTIARWKPAKGRTATAPVARGKDGSLRILKKAATYTAKFRNGQGIVVEKATGCRDEGAARSVTAWRNAGSSLSSGVMSRKSTPGWGKPGTSRISRA